MNELTNFATAVGNYNNLKTTIQSDTVKATLIDNLEINKSSSKGVWAIGDLIYTITVINSTNVQLENVTITDILNTKYVKLLVESLRINGIPGGYSDFKYDNSTGMLTVVLPIIEPNQNIVISFAVTKRKSDVFIVENYASLIFDGNMLKSNVVTVSALPEICRCKELGNMRNNMD